MEDLKFSLICTVFNEGEGIIDFLNSYKLQCKKANEFIILDGGSSDSTVQLVENFKIQNPELNMCIIIDNTCNKSNCTAPISKGRNIAIEHAQYDIIVTTDAGCILSKYWFKKLVEPYYEYPETLATGGVYETNPNSQFAMWYIDNFMPNKADFYNNNFLPSSRNFSFRKHVWQKAGKYPYGTFAGEDTKFVLEIKKLGVDIFMTEACVSWVCPSSVDEAKLKHFQYAFGDGYHKQFYSKYILSTFKLPIILMLSFFYDKYSLKLEMSRSINRGFWKGVIKRWQDVKS